MTKILTNLKLFSSVPILLFSSVPIFAGGIATTFVNVNLEDLSINKEYNQPLKVMNRSDRPLNILIFVQIPQTDNLKSDCIPIPTTNWLKVVPTQYTLPAGQTGLSDVFIKIPKNKKLRGKTFQVNLEICGYPSEKKGGVTFVPSLLSKLRFSIAKKKKFLGLW